MKESHKELVGVFRHLDSLIDSMNRLRKMGLQDFIVLSPVPHYEIEKALGEKRSSIRLFTLIGALAGCAGGFGLAIFAALKWGLIVGGKPLLSIPPFIVVAFEMTILLAALATIMGLLVLAFWRVRKGPVYDPRFTQDHFGVVVRCPEKRLNQAKEMFKSAGASEIYSK